jgi:hypothetical protein
VLVGAGGSGGASVAVAPVIEADVARWEAVRAEVMIARAEKELNDWEEAKRKRRVPCA